MKKENLDFEVARDFFVEMKYYTIQNYFETNVGTLDFVILDIDFPLNWYCLRSLDHLAYALRYAIILSKSRNDPKRAETNGNDLKPVETT